MSTSYRGRAPHCGQTNQPIASPSLMAKYADPLLRARKGHLYLLCQAGADPMACGRVYELYYADPCFDVLPCLQAALSAAHAAVADGRSSMPLAMVLQGLDVFAVGTDEAAMFLVRAGEVHMLLGGDGQDNDSSTEERSHILYVAQRRLNIGDALVMSTRQARSWLTRYAPARVLNERIPIDRVASDIAAAAARGGQSRRVPVTVLRIPGFSPVPAFGGGSPPVIQRPPQLRARRRLWGSPIWTAAILGCLAVATTLALRQPQVSWDSFSSLARKMLTPDITPATSSGSAAYTPTVTSTEDGFSVTPSATARPTASPVLQVAKQQATPTVAFVPSPTARNYPVPQLAWPKRGQDVREDAVVLRWSWPGSLAEDEYFDVRLWREGSKPQSIAWTKEREYTERYVTDGWYHWTIVVVRGKDSVIERELSREPDAVSFHYSSPDETPDQSAATTPTPIPRPTRVNPGPSR